MHEWAALKGFEHDVIRETQRKARTRPAPS